MSEKINLNIVVREEKEGKKKIFIINNEELGVADFGGTLDEALNNFKKSVRLYLETYPEKKEELISRESELPPLLTRVLI